MNRYFTFLKGQLVEIDEENELMRYLINPEVPSGKFLNRWDLFDYLEERMEHIKWIPYKRNQGAVIDLRT